MSAMGDSWLDGTVSFFYFWRYRSEDRAPQECDPSAAREAVRQRTESRLGLGSFLFLAASAVNALNSGGSGGQGPPGQNQALTLNLFSESRGNASTAHRNVSSACRRGVPR